MLRPVRILLRVLLLLALGITPAAEAALPYLRDALQSPRSGLRYLAVEALANLGPAAEPLLREATGTGSQGSGSAPRRRWRR